MPKKEYRIWYTVDGAGYADIKANSLDEAIQIAEGESFDVNFEICDDLNWEFDEEFTRKENPND